MSAPTIAIAIIIATMPATKYTISELVMSLAVTCVFVVAVAVGATDGAGLTDMLVYAVELPYESSPANEPSRHLHFMTSTGFTRDLVAAE